MGDLTIDFSKNEFECNCGCGLNNINKQFVNRLQKARTKAEVPFLITSGCRCTDWNTRVGGSVASDHLASKDVQGMAADISCHSARMRYIVITALLAAGFKRIGIGRTFVHAGMSETSPQEVLWVY